MPPELRRSLDTDQNHSPALPHLDLDSESQLATRFGTFQLLSFLSESSETPIIVLTCGTFETVDSVLVRVQSKCTTSEVFGSLQCDCGDQLKEALTRIQAQGTGVFIYLDQEARGNGLRAKLRIYDVMQHMHLSSDEACAELGYPQDARTYEGAGAVLKYFGIAKIRLLTNNPAKVAALQAYGLQVKGEPLITSINEHNHDYLLEKQLRHGHRLGIELNSSEPESLTRRPTVS